MAYLLAMHQRVPEKSSYSRRRKMKNNYRRFLITTFALALMAIFSGSAEAQWQFVKAKHDNAGHLIYFEERTRMGDIRIERKEYHRGTHIVAHLQRRITRADNSVINMVEQRDTHNRYVFIQNKQHNGAGVLMTGSEQRWVYNGPRDRYGRQTNLRYDRGTTRWLRF
jgi:hypothetical protein